MTRQTRTTTSSMTLPLTLALALAGCGDGKLGEKTPGQDGGVPPPDGATLADLGDGSTVKTIRVAVHNRTPCPVAPQGVVGVSVTLFEKTFQLVTDPTTGLLIQKGSPPFDVKQTLGPCLVTAGPSTSAPYPATVGAGPAAVTVKVGSGPTNVMPLGVHKGTKQLMYQLEVEPAPAPGTSITVTVKLPGRQPVVETLELMEPLEFTAPALIPTPSNFFDNNVYYVAHDKAQDLQLSWKASSAMSWKGVIHNYTNWIGAGDTLRCFGTYGGKSMTIPKAALQYDSGDTGRYFTFDHAESRQRTVEGIEVQTLQNAMSRTFRLLGPKSSLWSWLP